MASQRLDVTPDTDSVLQVLDGIYGAWERAQLGLRKADDGDTVTLDELEAWTHVELARAAIEDRVVVVTVQDARSSSTAAASRRSV